MASARLRNDYGVAAGSALLFLLLFAQFPLHRSLPGNTDSLLSIAISNLFLEKVALWLRGDALPLVLYPATRFLAYGENCYGLGFLFMLFKLLLRDDLRAYYLFLVSIFALDAFALYRLASLFTRGRAAAALAGLGFTLAGFTLSNIDDPNMVFVFFPVMALYWLERWSREGRRRDLRLAVFLSALQIWFGLYVFLFQGLALAVFAAFRLGKLRARVAPGEALRLLGIYALTSGPLLALYLHNHFHAEVFSPYDNPYSLKASSLSWHHFRNVLPGNLLYSDRTNVWERLDASGWYRLRKTCFPGLLLPALGLLGAWATRKKTAFFSTLFLVFFTLSFGANLPFFELLTGLPLGGYFRVASRFYLFALVPAALFFALGAERLATRAGRWVLIPVAALFVIENVPFPLARYDYGALLEPPAEYTRFFGTLDRRQVVADLPSTYKGRLPDTIGVWSYSRDILYMNWQTYHHQAIVGGVNSYIPVSRVGVERLLQAVPAREALAQLSALGVRYVVFHRDLVLIPEEDILSRLKQTPELKLAAESPRMAIFELRI